MGLIQDKTAGLVSTKTAVLAGLLVAPIIVYSVMGSIAVWHLGWVRWLWWLAPIAWSLTWCLAKLWPAAPPRDYELQPKYWTPRDQEAAVIIQRFQEDVEQYSTEQLTDPHFYLNQAQSLANGLARHYRPGTTDPISDRTLPELLAACRLVADDLEELVLTTVPGSRMLTVNQWRKLGEAPRLVRQATKAFWATKILLNPFNLAQWGTSKITNEKVTTNLQSELLAALYVRFVKQLGYYLIEMNSGRLRAGAGAYRAAFGTITQQSERKLSLPTASDSSTGVSSPISTANPIQAPDVESTHRDRSSKAAATPTDSPVIKIAVMGKRGVGKTMLIEQWLNLFSAANNSLNGDQNDIVYSPTRTVQSHHLPDSQFGIELHLLDPPGYEAVASGKALNKPILFAVENAQAIVLMLDPVADHWAADKALLEGIQDAYRKLENLRPPKVIAVFSYSAISSPLATNRSHPSSKAVDEALQMTSDPTSSALDGRQHEEQGRREVESAIVRAQEHFQTLIDDYVPQPIMPNAEPTRFFSALFVVLTRHLDAARSSAVLAAFEASVNKGKYRILLSQAKNSGKRLISSWLRRE